MKKTKRMPVIPCGVALIRRERQFLISQRTADDTFGSFWEFPGGKRNTGESFENCVIREAKEELGIEVAVQKKFMEIKKEFNGKIIWLNFYLCSYISGDPQPLECQKVLWVDIADLRNFGFPPANEKVIENLMKVYGGQSLAFDSGVSNVKD